MIPFFNSLIYPPLAKCNLLKTNLQRLGAGFFLAALAFAVSGIVDLQLEKTYPKLPPAGDGQLIAYDLLPSHLNCQLNFKLGDVQIDQFTEARNLKKGSYQLNMTDPCGYVITDDNITITITEKESTSLYFWTNHLEPNILRIEQAEYYNRIEKSSRGKSYIKVIW